MTELSGFRSTGFSTQTFKESRLNNSFQNWRMTRMKTNNGMKLVLFLGMAFMLLCAGCASSGSKMATDASGLPQMTNFADDIKDITLPTELQWDRKNSMVIKTESFRGGVFTYKGRAEIMSLKDYMIASMQDNKWRLVGETASKNIMLAFIKPNKTCMMVIAEGVLGKTELKLYVAIDKTGGGGAGSVGDSSGSFGESFSQ
ncbi:hypothetical protein [Desulfobulbus propionicus]|jgi:hypothetical protein|nr:hypothetical protein [Desulfobulbus propionicus]